MSAAQDAQIALAVQAAQQAARAASESANQAKAAALALNQIAANALYWQGVWDGNRYYTKYSTVTFNGASYMSLADVNKNHSPDTNPSWWQPLGAAEFLVQHDNTLTGDGTGGNPLSVVAGGTVQHVQAPLAGDGSSGSPLHITAATDSQPGSMSAADKTKLDGLTPSPPANRFGLIAGFSFPQDCVQGTFATITLLPDTSDLFPPTPPTAQYLGFGVSPFIIHSLKMVKVHSTGTLTGLPSFTVGHNDTGSGTGDEICRTQSPPSSFLTDPDGTVYDLTLASNQLPIDFPGGTFLSFNCTTPATGDPGSTCFVRFLSWGVFPPDWPTS